MTDYCIYRQTTMKQCCSRGGSTVRIIKELTVQACHIQHILCRLGESRCIGKSVIRAERTVKGGKHQYLIERAVTPVTAALRIVAVGRYITSNAGLLDSNAFSIMSFASEGLFS